MTLILALECAEGLLLASDSQATVGTSGQPVKAPTEKLYCGDWTNVAWGASGAAALIQRVDQDLRAQFQLPRGFEKETPLQLRKKLAKEVSHIVKPILTTQYLPTGNTDALLASFIFVAHTPSGPLLLEIGKNLQDEDHTLTGYVAIGSGDIFPYVALASLAHFNVRQRSLKEAKLIAYRIMDDAIAVAAHYLGPPIQMVEITKPKSGCGAARRLPDDELQNIADAVLGWKQVEAESLSEALGLDPVLPANGDDSLN